MWDTYVEPNIVVTGVGYETDLHSNDAIFVIAGNMEPSAGIHKRGIPTLQHIATINQILAQSIECIAFKVT